MGKNTNFTGQPIYSQLLKLTDKAKIGRISREGRHDRYVKKLDGYTHFVAFLYGVLMRFDSLREITIGMLSEANKLQHLGVNYLIRRSTFSEANNRRDSEFFAKIYKSLYAKYKSDLPDSRSGKEWERRLHIMDSTTISLFSNILRGAGRNPKRGKKKGGIKAHTVIKATEDVPYLVRFTSAATHDHCLLKDVKLSKGSIIAFDRAYIDYKEFERLTSEDITYVTKAKKSLTYSTIRDLWSEDMSGSCTYEDIEIEFVKGDARHRSRRLTYWDAEKGRSITLLTNNFDMSGEDIIEIYRHRWQIELLFKQLKQNFPLKYFYGDSVNAIKSQIWVTMIANLLLTIVKKRTSRKWSFSNLTTTIRQMLMYYIDLYRYLEDPERAWLDVIRNDSEMEFTPYLFHMK